MQTSFNSRNYRPIIVALAIAINLLIVLSFIMPDDQKRMQLTFLPLLNAILNSLTFISLMIALIAIRQKNIERHKRFVFYAFGFTLVFLISYLAYHFSTPSTKFGGTGFIRAVYFFVLLTHIPLAIIIVPLALISIGRGLNMEVERHRKIARWTMPLWLYVSLTGVIVYLMISPYYR